MTGSGHRVSMDVVTRSGAAAALEFRVQPLTVEIWRGECRDAVFDRNHLREWLDRSRGSPSSAREGPHVDSVRVGEVVFSIDRVVDRDGRVAISMPDVSSWTLSPDLLAELRRRL